jgi:hypothetical protein
MVVFQERTDVSLDRLMARATDRTPASSSVVSEDGPQSHWLYPLYANVERWQRIRPISAAMLRWRMRKRHHKSVKRD